MERDVERRAGVDQRPARARAPRPRSRSARAAPRRASAANVCAPPASASVTTTSSRGVTQRGARRGGCGGRAAARRSRRPGARGTATADRSARRSCGAARSWSNGAWLAPNSQVTRRAQAASRARSRPHAESSSRPGSRRSAPAGRARARSRPSSRRSRARPPRARASVSIGCVSVCGSKRTRPARSSARSSSQPASAGIAPGGYHENVRRRPSIAPGHDEDGAREAVLAQHRQRVLEDVAVAVVERERDRGLARREAQVVDLVEVDDALPALRERLHLAPEGVRRDRELVAVVRDAVVVEDAQAGPRRAAAEPPASTWPCTRTALASPTARRRRASSGNVVIASHDGRKSRPPGLGMH